MRPRFARVVPLVVLAVLAACRPASPEPAPFHPDQARLRRSVVELCAIQPPRNAENPASMKRAAERIAATLRGHGLRPVARTFSAGGRQYDNIHASIGPEGGERIIVGAHYDVCGDQPGADDNASAVAVMLECARLAKGREERLPYGVDFAAYALEEPPHFGTTSMGSHVHAEELKERGVAVRAMICLDMVGYFRDEPGSQSYPLPGMGLIYPQRGDFIAVAGSPGNSGLAGSVAAHLRAAGMPACKVVAPARLPGMDFSDHRNFWKFGFPAVLVTDTAFYRNPNYHQPTDTPDTLCYERMARVAAGLCRALFMP